MSIPEKYKGRYFYHFTHVDNIEKIVESGAILSTNLKKKLGITHYNVANTQIQNRRSVMKVPVGPGGVVHDYVPFYLATTNPMLFGLLNRKVVDQSYMCFMAIPIEKIEESHVVFTDASANTVIPPHFYESPEDLDKLDWELIDSHKWGEKSDEKRHHRMAEVLVYERVPIDWIDHFVVFDRDGREKILDFYEEFNCPTPTINYEYYTGRKFFYKKYFFEDRRYESLVTGPVELYMKYEQAIYNILQNKKHTLVFMNMYELLQVIKQNFCTLPELRGIYGLQTSNQMHKETVSDHTLSVVRNVKMTPFYRRLNNHDKRVVELAAYLHDIGKGPKEKWADGVQPVYSDHPADAIPMLERIMTDPMYNFSESEVQDICMLVVYHDLMGDIIGFGRSMVELKDLKLDKNQLFMLAALSQADIMALGNNWSEGLVGKLEELIQKALEE